MFDVTYLADLIRLTLTETPFPDVERSVQLLLGVAAQESGCCNVSQAGGGPAQGVFQIEPVTAQDLDAWVRANPPYEAALIACSDVQAYSENALAQNLAYQVFLGRTLFYTRDDARLPALGDIEGDARIWKKYFNTYEGSGTEEQYIANYEALIAPVYHPLPELAP